MSIYLRKEHSGLRGVELVNIIESTYPHLRNSDSYWRKRVRRDIKEHCHCLGETPYLIYASHYLKLHTPVIIVECVSKSEVSQEDTKKLGCLLYSSVTTMGDIECAHIEYNAKDWPNICVPRDTKPHVVVLSMQLAPYVLTDIVKITKLIRLLCMKNIPGCMDARITMTRAKCYTYDTPGVTLVVSHDKGQFSHSSLLPAGIIASLLCKDHIISPNMQVDDKDVNTVHIPNFTDVDKAKRNAKLISTMYNCTVEVL